MKKLGLIAAILALPALAQAPQFHVALSGQFGNYTGNSELLAVESYNGNGYGGPATTYQMKSKTPLQLDLGIQKGDDDFTLSYWAGKAKGNGAFTAPSSGTFSDPYQDYYPFYRVGMTAGHSEVKAHTLDIAWTRTFVKNDQGSMAFSLGLREFKIQRDMVLDLWDTGAPMLHEGIDHLSASTKGFGLLAGLSGRYNLNQRVWLTGGLKLAMTDGKSDFDFSLSPDATNYPGYGDPYLQVELNGQKQNSLQVDMDLKLNVNFVAGFDGFVGYQMKSFHDVLGNDAGSPYGYNTVTNFTPRAVAFDGVIVGLGYRF